MTELHLSNDHVALSVAPDFGARITTLVDRRTGRDWLVAGALEGAAGDEAVFGGREACGWDECFPTVAPCMDPTHGRMLRDHGDLWGRPWSCSAADGTIRARFDGAGWWFGRDLVLAGRTVEARYEVTNTGDDPLPYLWSQHCLLATGPGDRINLEGIGPMTVTGGVSPQGPVAGGLFEWPELSTALPDLRTVRDASAGFAIKAYAPVDDVVSASVGGADGSVRFSWAKADVPFLGLWLDYGGWPQDRPVHQIAIEPTTAAADDLAAAHENRQVRWLAPRETHKWMVTMTLSPTAMRNGERHVE